MARIEVEYNQELKPLETILAAVKNPGSFYVSGTEEMPMPRVEVEGVGMLSFPVPAAQIKTLLRVAEQAPYGRGPETIVDTSVRNVWQISPAKVEIGGKSWAANFKAILAKVAAGLGCRESTVSAELYKLLVYRQGGFFLAHRDTEKTAGMFGTLVVTLPSGYSGGALRIRHGGREVTVETNAAEPSELSYVAFFADCEHEALPVRNGSRVCLVYNLIHRHAKGKRGIPRAPEYESHAAAAAEILERRLNEPDAPAKLAWLLQHHYSPAGLSFSGLKGADAAQVRVLLQAAEVADCAAHLGIVHIGESGAAEYYGGRSRGSYRRRYWRDDDEDGSDEDDDGFETVDESDFSVESVDEQWRYVDEWKDTADRDVAFGRIPLEDGELLPANALDGVPPDEQRVTEASGNEGATYERSYHRAAIVLWRRNREADVLLRAGVLTVFPLLRRLAADGGGAKEAVRLAERILEAWPRDEHKWEPYRTRRDSPQPSHRREMVTILTDLKAPDLLGRFVREVLTVSYDGSENAVLAASVGVMADQAAPAMGALVTARMRLRPAGCAGLLAALAKKMGQGLTDVAEAAVTSLDRIGEKETSKTSAWNWRHDEPEPLGPEFVTALLGAVEGPASGSLCGAAAGKIAARPEVFDPVALVIPAIEQICARSQKVTPALDDAVRLLWLSAAEFLLARSEVPPQPPTDWRIEVKISCPCPDCEELRVFCHHPGERVHRFRVNKDRRQHLHGMIDRCNLDMTHVTERVGSPQTLVCTKDRRTFDRRVKQYKSDVKAMRRLALLAHEGTPDLARRLEAAVKLAPPDSPP